MHTNKIKQWLIFLILLATISACWMASACEAMPSYHRAATVIPTSFSASKASRRRTLLNAADPSSSTTNNDDDENGNELPVASSSPPPPPSSSSFLRVGDVDDDEDDGDDALAAESSSSPWLRRRRRRRNGRLVRRRRSPSDGDGDDDERLNGLFPDVGTTAPFPMMGDDADEARGRRRLDEDAAAEDGKHGRHRRKGRRKNPSSANPPTSPAKRRRQQSRRKDGGVNRKPQQGQSLPLPYDDVAAAAVVVDPSSPRFVNPSNTRHHIPPPLPPPSSPPSKTRRRNRHRQHHHPNPGRDQDKVRHAPNKWGHRDKDELWCDVSTEYELKSSMSGLFVVPNDRGHILATGARNNGRTKWTGENWTFGAPNSNNTMTLIRLRQLHDGEYKYLCPYTKGEKPQQAKYAYKLQKEEKAWDCFFQSCRAGCLEQFIHRRPPTWRDDGRWDVYACPGDEEQTAPPRPPYAVSDVRLELRDGEHDVRTNEMTDVGDGADAVLRLAFNVCGRPLRYSKNAALSPSRRRRPPAPPPSSSLRRRRRPNRRDCDGAGRRRHLRRLHRRPPQHSKRDADNNDDDDFFGVRTSVDNDDDDEDEDEEDDADADWETDDGLDGHGDECEDWRHRPYSFEVVSHHVRKRVACYSPDRKFQTNVL